MHTHTIVVEESYISYPDSDRQVCQYTQTNKTVTVILL